MIESRRSAEPVQIILGGEANRLAFFKDKRVIWFEIPAEGYAAGSSANPVHYPNRERKPG